jgi:hypothetical protein
MQHLRTLNEYSKFFSPFIFSSGRRERFEDVELGISLDIMRADVEAKLDATGNPALGWRHPSSVRGTVQRPVDARG